MAGIRQNRNYKHDIIFVFQLIILFIHHRNIEGDITNIYVTNEDGNHQVFNVKRLQPVKNDACLYDCLDGEPSGITRSSTTVTFQSPSLIPSMTVIVGEFAFDCDKLKKEDLPTGLCSEKKVESCPSEGDKIIDEELFMNYAEIISEKNLVPFATKDKAINTKIAYGTVLLNTGHPDLAIQHFTKLIRDHPKLVAAYHGRSASYARKGLQHEANAALAVEDLTKAIALDPDAPEGYERRAELNIPLGLKLDALKDLNKAIELKPTWKTYFLRGNIKFLTGELMGAEKDFRKALDMNPEEKLHSLHHLGLAMFYRGKVRGAIEVFKEVIEIDPNFQDVHTSLAQAYRELGNVKSAQKSFNTSLNIKEDFPVLQLQGSMFYYSGNPEKAIQALSKCLSQDPFNQVCQYIKGLSYAAMGRFYEGIKAHTKVMVYKPQITMKLTGEYIKAHYLREYSRYLHAHLDYPLRDLKLDVHLPESFRDHWAKMIPFDLKSGYKEQPGLKPSIRDVEDIDLSYMQPEIKDLLCKAWKVGTSTQVHADGFLPNTRLNFAMGLAALQVAQTLDQYWKDLKSPSPSGSRISWREVFDIVIKYRRLVDPEQPVFWLDKMSEEFYEEGYTADFNLIRGEVINIKLMQYFDLVFKLIKTMVEHYGGEGMENFPKIKAELQKVEKPEELLAVAKKRKLNEQGFVITTQVPGTKDTKNKHEGVVLALTGDLGGKLVLSMNVATSKSRTATYHAELDHLFNELSMEIKKNGLTKISEVDNVTNLILTMVYYFYNLMPLTRGSSVVAYTVALGLFMSIGREVTGKIPQGKLLDVEAMLSGAPDAFIMVTKQWINIKKINTQVSSLPKVSETFPTVRSVIEVLNLGALDC